MAEKTILVIDTDTETIRQIMSTLESEGYLVFIASDRDDSITTAKKIHPSLIYINIALSGGSVSSLEICEAIHETETLSNVPIVIMTPHEIVIEARYTSLYGIVDFLKTPFSPEDLISKTIDVIEMHPEAKYIEERLPTSEREEGEEKRFEEEVLAESIPAGEAEVLSVSEEVTEKPAEETGSTLISPLSSEEFEEIKPDLMAGSEERDKTYIPMRRRRERKKSISVLPIILLILLGVAAVVLFSVRQITKSPPPMVATPPKPAQQEPMQTAQPEKPLTSLPVEETRTAPPPAPAPEKKPEAKPFYSVQIGAYKNEVHAESLVKKYKEAGLDAFLYKSTLKDGGILYRVLIGEFESRKEAAQLADSIRSKEKINVIIFHE